MKESLMSASAAEEYRTEFIEGITPINPPEKPQRYYFSGEHDLLHILGSMQLMDISPFHTIVWACFGCDCEVRNTVGKRFVRDIHAYHTKTARNIVKACRGTVLYANSDSVVASFADSLDGIITSETVLSEVLRFNQTVKTMSGGLCVKTAIFRDEYEGSRHRSLEHIILAAKELVERADPLEMSVSEDIVEENKNTEYFRKTLVPVSVEAMFLTPTGKYHPYAKLSLNRDN